jgi:hypothetical protein
MLDHMQLPYTRVHSGSQYTLAWHRHGCGMLLDHCSGHAAAQAGPCPHMEQGALHWHLCMTTCGQHYHLWGWHQLQPLLA